MDYASFDTSVSATAYLICSPAKPHQEIIRLDISVEETFRVNIFHPVDLQRKQHFKHTTLLVQMLRFNPQTSPQSFA
jgi:hypothetical protein